MTLFRDLCTSSWNGGCKSYLPSKPRRILITQFKILIHPFHSKSQTPLFRRGSLRNAGNRPLSTNDYPPLWLHVGSSSLVERVEVSYVKQIWLRSFLSCLYYFAILYAQQFTGWSNLLLLKISMIHTTNHGVVYLVEGDKEHSNKLSKLHSSSLCKNNWFTLLCIYSKVDCAFGQISLLPIV